MILNMPAEGWKHHSHIKPGDLHPGDVSVNVAEERLLQQRHHIQVPATAGVILTKKREFPLLIFGDVGFLKQYLSDNAHPLLLWDSFCRCSSGSHFQNLWSVCPLHIRQSRLPRCCWPTSRILSPPAQWEPSTPDTHTHTHKDYSDISVHPSSLHNQHATF